MIEGKSGEIRFNYTLQTNLSRIQVFGTTLASDMYQPLV